jgi:diketogulonate reductase-like aldo/keto reductase
VQTTVLNNDVEMPAIGLGVFQTPPDVTTAAVEEALRLGYRHIDTAAAYFNEREVGEGIRRSGIARDDVFIETKVWISDYGYDATLHALDKSAGKLGVDQLDLLILHQPMPVRFDLTLDAYRALEKLLADRKVRAIGVSNFVPEHLERLLNETSVVPPSTRSSFIRTSSKPSCSACTPRTASCPRPGRPSAASPPTGAARRARSTTRRCWRSRASTASRPHR